MITMVLRVTEDKLRELIVYGSLTEVEAVPLLFTFEGGGSNTRLKPWKGR